MKKKHLNILLILCLFCNTSFSQTKMGVENYNFLNRKMEYIWMPVVHHQTKKGFYTELRYNYEDIKTGSLYFGRSFAGGKNLEFDIIPMLGIVVGKYNGASAAVNIELEYKNLFLSIHPQYTINKDKDADTFYFNWSELAYQPLKFMYAGVSVQQTKLYKTAMENEYGLLLCFVAKKYSFPVYLFSPFRKDQNFIVGVNMEW